jgi:hypothetical protein
VRKTKSPAGDVYNLMSAPREGAECLAEIFREILALSGTKRLNDSKSAAADDPRKLFDAQCVNGIDQNCEPREKQAGDEDNDSEDGDCHR